MPPNQDNAPLTVSKRLGPFKGLGARLLGVVLLLSCIGVWVLSADARREIDALATANSDSTQWSLAQAEVELLTLKNALLAAVLDDSAENLTNVRSRFDVFYSRMATISSAPVFTEVRSVPDVQAALEVVRGFMDDAIASVDGGDDTLRADLAMLSAKAQAMRTELRTISLAGVQIFSAKSEQQRARVARALLELAVLTFSLLFVMVAFVVVLVRLLSLGHSRTEATRAAEDRLSAVVRTSLDGIVAVDRQGIVVEFNGAAERIFGYSPDDAIGQPMADLIVPDHLKDAHQNGMARHLSTGEKRVVDQGLVQLEARDKSGRVFPVELSISSAHSRTGEIFVSYIRDISQRVAAQEELVEARDKALAGEKAKAEMLAVMSHEMRTPLNGIIGSLQLLSDTSLTNRQRKFVDAMDTSSAMLLRHVNTVLDISRADAGQIEMSRQRFDPVELSSDVLKSLESQAKARQNKLKLNVLGDEIGLVIGDPGRLGQVLVNLLGNAIKFTEDGLVTVEIERLQGGSDVEFRVSDTGIGIPDEDLERIFSDFVTLDSSFTRNVEGTGLGLGIARRLVDVMDGQIGVESEAGLGAVFWVRLPLPRVETTQICASNDSGINAHHANEEASLSVLLIEDNEINRLVAREMLTSLGCVTTEACDGLEGVEMAQKRVFDLILMDISMPRLDGLEATERIRSVEGPNAHTPIFAVTAHALPHDIERFQSAGMTDVILKPIEKERLTRVLNDLHVRTTAGDLPAKHGPVPSHSAQLDELEEVLGKEGAKDIMRRVTAELSEGLETLHQMSNQQTDMAQIAALAHKLAGLAALIGLSTLRGHLIEAEDIAKSGDEATLSKLFSDNRFVFQDDSAKM